MVEHLRRDVTSVFLAARKGRDYSNLILIGKSLGTYGIHQILELNEARMSAHCVYLTPILDALMSFAANGSGCEKSVVFIGTEDRNFNPGLLDRLASAALTEVVIIEGANHDLEFPGDLSRTVATLKEVMEKVQAFLD